MDRRDFRKAYTGRPTIWGPTTARTLAQNPEIILADEPVADLTAKAVMEDFQAINQDDKISDFTQYSPYVELAWNTVIVSLVL